MPRTRSSRQRDLRYVPRRSSPQLVLPGDERPRGARGTRSGGSRRRRIALGVLVLAALAAVAAALWIAWPSGTPAPPAEGPALVAPNPGVAPPPAGLVPAS